ncbi:LysR substrate-binding domain-containing protein [Agrobacterium rhizogenes]|uniref:LysR substrate-binding domain-containing protein n=1 Tax=Rhizobium rhizogenes TaxID=359 RepID=UPI0022B6CA53|nr:LysR substrate-binding domain-containing protein [Rhizobium rhizogenes]MCZ7450829.1 LysR substrate-binding domain-containing protein [Rhizobium rhizogenes]
MKRKLPPLNWLRSFEAAARSLNFTIAGDELNLTQAAISQQIKGLETHLGTPLFKRKARGIELTDAGRAYMPAVRESIERLSVATNEIFGGRLTRVLTVRVNLVFFMTWLSSRLMRFRQMHPDIVLHFSSNIWVEDEKREVDIEIRYGSGRWNGLLAERLTRDELVPVCSPSIMSNGTFENAAVALGRNTLLHVIGYEEGWGYWLKQREYWDVDVSRGLQFDTLISALEMAALGHGFALGRTSLIANFLESGRLIAPFDERVPTTEAFYAVRPTHRNSTPQMEAFWNWLTVEAGQNDPA